jgi:Kdo2-lipid IVA lauroyltransferase/acyltransferase
MKRREMSRTWVTVLFQICWTLLRCLPLPVAAAFTSWAMRTFAENLTRQDLIRENLAKAFPEMPPEEIRTTARAIAGNLGVIAAELCHIEDFHGGGKDGRLTMTGEKPLALAKAGPVIFVGPHQWNWEIAPLFYSEYGVRVTTIYSPFVNDVMDRAILKQRLKTGAKYVEKRKAVRAMMEALGSGESLAFVIDQRVKSGLKVKFFGRDFLMTGVPARLAIRFRCPIVLVDMERLDGHRFHFMLGDPIYPPEKPGADAERELTQAIASGLETIIRRAPETWFCNKRRWPESDSAQSFARST